MNVLRNAIYEFDLRSFCVYWQTHTIKHLLVVKGGGGGRRMGVAISLFYHSYVLKLIESNVILKCEYIV